MTVQDISARRPIRVGLAASALLVLGFGAWAVTIQLEGAVVAQGHVVVSGERQIVQHPDGGVIAVITVKEAQTVRKGDLLLRLDGRALRTELSIVEGQLFELTSRRARLEAEATDRPDITFAAIPDADTPALARIAELNKGQLALFETRLQSEREERDQYAKQLAQIDAQVVGLSAQKAALEEQSRLTEQELADQQSLLDKGLTQSVRVTSLQKDAANLKGQIGALIAQAAQAEQRSAEIALQITRLATTRREEAATQLREVLPQENELTARRLDLRERLSRLEIRAPVSGIVMGLQMTTPGAVIRPADLILSIVPQDRPLEIQLQISPLNIDEVHGGQRVRLTFPTFQSRTMPEVWSEVRSLSADAFTDQKSQSSYYRADIDLSPEAIKELGSHNLLPGMPVQAFIQTGNRSPFDYLVKPFEDYFNMAFKES